MRKTVALGKRIKMIIRMNKARSIWKLKLSKPRKKMPSQMIVRQHLSNKRLFLVIKIMKMRQKTCSQMTTRNLKKQLIALKKMLQ